jgi:general nucleoside transport system permease protein
MHNGAALDSEPGASSRGSRSTSVRLILEVRQTLPFWKRGLFLFGALGLGLTFSVGILSLAGVPPQQLTLEFVEALNGESLRAVLVQMAPLVLVGLSASLAFRIGFWNLGLEGQMVFGGIFATAISIYEIGPAPARLIIMGAAAALGGAVWCLIAGVLKIGFRVNEIISTLLLNYIAGYFLLHLLYGSWQDARSAFPQSTPFRQFERIPHLQVEISYGLIVAIAAVIVAIWIVHLSRIGFYMKYLSANPIMAGVMGFPTRRVLLFTTAVSGACSGLAGFINIAGQEGRLTQSFASGYVFSGVLIGFLSRNDPIVVLIISFLLATLYIVGQTLQVFYQIPFSMVQMIEAVIVMCVACSEFLVRHRIRLIGRLH